MPTPTPIGREFAVNTTLIGDQNASSVIGLANGRFVATWTDASQTFGDTSAFAVRGQVFNANGTKLGAEFLVNTATENGQTEPALTAFADGRFVAVWKDDSQTGGDTQFSAIRGQVFNADGTKSGVAFLVNTDTGNSQTQASVATLANGGFVVSWTDGAAANGDASGAGISAQVFNANGTKVGADFSVVTQVIGNQVLSSLAGLADGRFVAVWQDDSSLDSSSSGVTGQIFNADGSKSGAEFGVPTSVSNAQTDPVVTALANGGFVAAWQDRGSADLGLGVAVKAQLYTAGGIRSGGEFTLNGTSVANRADPAITALKDGRFVAVWQENGATGNDTIGASVRAQVFNANGTKSGTEFVVNTTKVGDQFDASVTELEDGRLAITWSDNSGVEQDQSGTVVYGQIFDPRIAAVNLTGTAGADDYLGSAFADRMSGAQGDDALSGGAGADSLSGGDGSDQIAGGADNDALSGGGGADSLSGGAGADILSGADGDDRITGEDGNDALAGGAGNDALSGGNGGDRLSGSGGNDRLFGGADADRLFGGAGRDRLAGDAGDDRLAGGAGNDKLVGGLGRDVMNGGRGADDFVFASAAEAKGDRIDRFTHRVDDIDLRAFMDDGQFIGRRGFTDTAGDVRYVQSTGRLSGDVDGDGVADWLLTIGNKATLTAEDFIF